MIQVPLIQRNRFSDRNRMQEHYFPFAEKSASFPAPLFPFQFLSENKFLCRFPAYPSVCTAHQYNIPYPNTNA